MKCAYFFAVSIVVAAGLSGCTKQKEEMLLKQIESASQTGTQLSPMDRATKEPNFENEINAGFALSQAGDHERALVFFERARKRYPKSPIALNNICAEQNHLKRWKLAADHCRLAIEFSPEFELARNNLKHAEEQMKAQMKTVDKLASEMTGASSKKRIEAEIDLGFEHYKMGDYPKAVEIWKAVKTPDQSSEVLVLNNIGSAFILQRDFARAREILERAKSKFPDDTRVQSNLKWLEEAQVEMAQ